MAARCLLIPPAHSQSFVCLSPQLPVGSLPLRRQAGQLPAEWVGDDVISRQRRAYLADDFSKRQLEEGGGVAHEAGSCHVSLSPWAAAVSPAAQ